MIDSTILQSRGYRNFIEVEDGFKAVPESNVRKKKLRVPWQSNESLIIVVIEIA